MEKPIKTKRNLFNLLPKPTRFSIPKAPNFSPKNRHKRRSSAPIVSIIPPEARRKPRQAGGVGGDASRSSFEGYQEPKSPKVSCIGKIKHKKKPSSEPRPPKPKKPCFSIKRVFCARASKEPTAVRPPPAAAAAAAEEGPAPLLGKMRRFASGRDALGGFDWRAHVGDDDGGFGEEEDFGVAHSAPVVMGGGGGVGLEAKKEVNLWKRRTVACPRPLKVKPL
ncbi:Uncharacterized protein QJS10_CPB11g02061 [Acorus calamus]|uniref:Syringolide-induced protein 14-1-1 n=1 Tax=Acorus calamus TaxID=4465 RepID=A0AAV9DT30_ACOCL|nr:Uncharacterized protein QJS10_CPB11g02063 [Acorus calamus]KAK1304332.1 Uncharacterized protein QJS10_CPB11g02061 [Acorus calamus]